MAAHYYIDGTYCKCYKMQREFFPLGVLQLWEAPCDNHGKVNGCVRWWYTVNPPMLACSFSAVNDKEHGLRRIYNEKGLLTGEELFLLGCLQEKAPAENFL